MSKFAQKTRVPIQQSRTELERLLEKYGAGQFVYGTKADSTVIGFSMANRMVRFEIPMPTEKQSKNWEQERRVRWRAIVLVVKAKLEAVESGISTFEAEFLAHVVLPNGLTVGKWMQPQLEQTYAGGKMPPLLPGY